MIFAETALQGAILVTPEKIEDDRGFFARSWCAREFAAHGLETALAQCNISYNRVRGTLRGMHFQAEPHGEAKLVRCTRGSVYDVIVDLRPTSPTYCRWAGFELNEENRRMIYVPKGFAHGFQTLTDDTELFYQMSDFYVGDRARGVSAQDPVFGIEWPLAVTAISDADRSYPEFVP